jgi:acetylornithine/N-succinyldiaminopimelate aminotransferase
MTELVDWYPYFPMRILRAKGMYMLADDGKRYMDTFSGLGVHLLGHEFEPLMQKMHRKMRRYTHLSNFFKDEDLEPCVESLMEASGLRGGVFFSNSGTEASECAMKIVKKHAGASRRKVLYFKQAFHGRTLGALSVNGFEGLTQAFHPLLPDTVELPWNDASAFHEYMGKCRDQVMAVFVEVVQGAGGVRVMSSDMIQTLQEWREKAGFWLVCDEIQSGLGRTGAMFSYQHDAMLPDMVLLGKGLGGGLPLGGVILHERLKGKLLPGDHGSTFAPNPVALAGCRVLLKRLPDLLPLVQELSVEAHRLIQTELGAYVSELRGRGYMIGVELKEAMPSLRMHAMKSQQLLLNVLQDRVVRLLPPLNISLAQWKKMIQRLALSLEELSGC